MDEDTRKKIALWRYQVIAPLLVLTGPRGTRNQLLRVLSERIHEHPLKGPVKLGLGTIEEWLYLYRREGLEGLLPRGRKDRGKSRFIDEELAERIEKLARGRPELDGPGLLSELCGKLDGKPLPSLSTLYRFLRTNGLDQRRAPLRRDHRAYAFELAGDCWQADVMHGPAVPIEDGSRRKTYLLAILDDATRVIAHAEFYFAEHLRSLKDCLKQAILKRGIPLRFYVDNGQIFRSRLLLQVAARLAVELIHTRPYRPQGRAKLERWFGTVRRSFLARLDLGTLHSLDHLNRLLFAWVEGEYHVSPHRGLDGETPLDRWIRLSGGIRPLPQDVDLDELLLEETTRRVAKDGTFTLKGKVFEAGPELIGERVRISFDPFDLRQVIVKSDRGGRLEVFPVDLSANRRVARKRLPEAEPRDPPKLRFLEDLARGLEERKENRDEEGDTEEGAIV